MSASIARTGFYVSLISYLAFWLMDALWPGFVARVFSVHIFLLATLIFGIWWALSVKEYTERAWLEWFLALAFGILLAVITWRLSSGLEMFRLIVVILAFFVPLVFLKISK